MHSGSRSSIEHVVESNPCRRDRELNDIEVRMNENTATIWKLSLAILALIAGIAVYVFLRQHPPALFAPLQIPTGFSDGSRAIFGSAPAFLHTFAICLLIGACVSSLSSALGHGLLWIAIALGFEFSQSVAVASRITGWLDGLLPDGVLEIVIPYWSRGVFDPLDIAAILAGGAIALYLQIIFARRQASHADR